MIYLSTCFCYLINCFFLEEERKEIEGFERPDEPLGSLLETFGGLGSFKGFEEDEQDGILVGGSKQGLEFLLW